MSVPVHPDWWPHSSVVPPTSDMNQNDSALSERSATVAGEGELLPIVYGRDRVGAKICALAARGNNWVVLCVWCHGGRGGVQGIEAVTTNGKPTDASVNWTHYLGLPTQGIDPTLALVIPGYADTLTGLELGEAFGVCYSVAEYSHELGFLDFEATINGLKLYDPRDPAQGVDNPATWVYSTNPALVLADFERSKLYGRSRGIDWASVAVVADACDELLSDGSSRRTLNLTLASQNDTTSWVDTLRGYAGCMVVRQGGTTKLVPNRPTPVSRALGVSDVVEGSLTLASRGLERAPTVVSVWYTDSTGDDWRERMARVYADGVLTGDLPWREAPVKMPGISTYAQALREAIERLNYSLLVDLEVSFETFDQALADQEGDVISLTHPLGLSAKALRVTGVQANGPGRWGIVAEEYDPAVYSDSIEDTPTTPDTNLPDPNNPPPPEGVVAVEELYQMQAGGYASRLRVNWQHPGQWPYSRRYAVRLLDAGQLVWESPATQSNEVASPAVRENVNYQIEVRLITSTGVQSDAATGSILALGKYLIPGDVPQITAQQTAADILLASWQPAIDIDIWRYELRRGAVGVAWEQAQLVDIVDGLSSQVEGLPAGQHDLLVKAVDSVRQRSANAARVTATIAKPQAPATLSGYEAGGTVHLQWSAGSGYVSAYELRYHPAAGGDWASATVLDRLNALRLVTSIIPVGDWVFLARSVDSAGNLSDGQASTTIHVSIDAAAFLVDEYEFHASSIALVEQWSNRPEDGKPIHALSEYGQSAATRWPAVMASYTGVLAGHHGGTGASEWLSDTWDAGTDLSGNWVAEINAGYLVAGTVNAALELSANGSDWTSYPALSAKTIARYARVRVAGASGGVFHLTAVKVRVDSIPMTESGGGTSSSTGPVTIALQNRYVAVKKLLITPQGSSARSAVADAIIIGGAVANQFDVYVFDNNGNRIASPFTWEFQGV